MSKWTVLGGSSPFTAALVDAILPWLAVLPRCELVLHGRNVDRLELVVRYARFHLEPAGWTVRGAADLAAAVHDASIIIHQIRYGGLHLRRAGEALCDAISCHADETLGPAALLTAIVTCRPLTTTCELIRKQAPAAAVINLTNPLSVTTSWMHRQGVTNVLGVCELPFVTALQVAELLNVGDTRLDWDYTGLNHRGFLHHMRVDGCCVLPEIVRRLRGRALGGVSSTTIQELGCIPTKYFRLLAEVPSPFPPSRATFLESLRDDLVAELTRNGSESPAGLRRRATEWYPHAVVPLCAALAGNTPQRHVVNAVGADGITREGLAAVSGQGVHMLETAEPPEPAAHWIDRFVRHERELLAGLGAPTRDWMHRVLTLDPLVPGRVDPMTDALQEMIRQEALP